MSCLARAGPDRHRSRAARPGGHRQAFAQSRTRQRLQSLHHTVEIQLARVDALRAHRARYAAQPADATQLITFGESKPDAALPAPEVAAWTLTASLLLNLDETLNR